MSKAYEAAHKLGYTGSEKKRYLVPCPGHADNKKTPSLGIGTDATTGEAWFNCWAGCDWTAIKNGLEAAGVDTANTQYKREGFKVECEHPLVGRFNAYFDESPNYALVTIYPYRRKDAQGNLYIYKFKARFSPKTFKWFHKTEQGWWKAREGPGPHYPYMWFERVLPAIEAGKRVIHVPEGEKDADTLFDQYGLISTTEGGAKVGFESEVLDELAKAKGVVVWGDNDKPGVKRGQEIALAIYNRKGKVKFLQSKVGKDITDWHVAGGKLEEINAHMGECPLYMPTHEQMAAAAKAGAIPETTYDPGSQAFAGAYFAHKHHQTVKFVIPNKQFYRHNGKVWAPDEGDSFRELAKGLHALLRKDMTHFSLDVRKDIERLATEVQTDRGVRAAIAMARSEPKILIKKNEFDAEELRLLFNCQNGVYNIKTGQMLEHDPKYRLTKISTLEAKFDRDPDEFYKFLFEVFEGRTAVVEYMLWFLAYCLTGDASFQKYQLWTSSVKKAGTGKSQLMTVMEALFGDYICFISASSLRECHQRSAGAESDLARTLGARVVFAAELSEKYQLDENVIKAITGGDPITVKFMNDNKFQLKSFAVPIFTANEQPPMSDDSGIARRIQPIFFERVFAEQQGEVASMGKKLVAACGPQLLGFLLKRAHELENADYQMVREMPSEVKTWTKEVRDHADTAARWIDDCGRLKPDGFTRSDKLFDSWRHWCKRNGEDMDPPNMKGLSSRLRKMGCMPDKDQTDQRGWKGVELYPH